MVTLTLIAAGSNLTSTWGNPRETILKARLFLEAKIDAQVKVSALYQTPAFPPGAGPDYVNAAFATDSTISANETLEILHQVEAEAGRERQDRWMSRTLDLDLIAFGDEVSPDLATWQQWADLDLDAQTIEAPDQLILPHPRLQDRSFALRPLCDLAPNWRHPVLDLTLAELLEKRPKDERESVQAI